ncbi:T9SS type A sorting domain-containing protein, partial [Candidatus Poribacteria bacterium]|nr:T9SS type A sorting domain-containing protein [Candidatus Poribacteria bacterium]
VSLFDAQAKKKAPEKMVGAKITPIKNLTPWDVNKDGVVNVLDLVIVASQFGQSGDSLTGDANGDGVVNVLDLVTVASHFGERAVAAGPSLHVERNVSLPVPNTEPIRRALVELETMPQSSRGVEIARRFLQAGLMKVPEPIVTETKLLSNYPNPFNPETWIPYQLARDAEVQVTIYDIKGSLVRRLHLGHQKAGYYMDRDSAAYWDGRNEAGERVTSGVYFYTFTAGAFTETRKLEVIK